MQVRNLRNRLRINMVWEWAWVSILCKSDLPKSKLVLLLGAQITCTGTYTSAHTYFLLPWHLKQNKSRCTVIAHTKWPRLTECVIYLTMVPNGPGVSTKLLYIISICTCAFSSGSEAGTTIKQKLPSHHGNYVKHLTLKGTVAQPIHYCRWSPDGLH